MHVHDPTSNSTDTTAPRRLGLRTPRRQRPPSSRERATAPWRRRAVRQASPRAAARLVSTQAPGGLGGLDREGRDDGRGEEEGRKLCGGTWLCGRGGLGRELTTVGSGSAVLAGPSVPRICLARNYCGGHVLVTATSRARTRLRGWVRCRHFRRHRRCRRRLASTWIEHVGGLCGGWWMVDGGGCVCTYVLALGIRIRRRWRMVIYGVRAPCPVLRINDDG